MMTKVQKELMDSFFLLLDGSTLPIYQDIVVTLLENGYRPKKEKSNISFKHSQHNKQIVKIGTRNGGNQKALPYFALRFSACKGYSKRFSDIVATNITKYPPKIASCLSGNCNYCAGLPHTHVYEYAFSDGDNKSHCGAYALEIPALSIDDIQELKKMIVEEHHYLIKHEATTK